MKASGNEAYQLFHFQDYSGLLLLIDQDCTPEQVKTMEGCLCQRSIVAKNDSLDKKNKMQNQPMGVLSRIVRK